MREVAEPPSFGGFSIVKIKYRRVEKQLFAVRL